MEACSFSTTSSLIFPYTSTPTFKPISTTFSFPTSKFCNKFSTLLLRDNLHQNIYLSKKSTHLHATLKSPKGFGAPKKKSKGNKNLKDEDEQDDEDGDDDDDNDEDDREQGVIPEIVTNRMISRVGFSVGVPLFTGLAFFPFFYYLKVGLKIDIPTWIPFIVSFVFFGTALAGVSYGIVSSSWDPLREGSFWGWNEAQKNWPVFWQSLRSGGTNSSSKK